MTVISGLLGLVFSGTGVRRNSIVGHHDDHRHDFLLGVEVVEDGRRVALLRPVGVISSEAMHQVEHRILLALRVARGRVDDHFATCAHRLRVIFDSVSLACRDPLLTMIKALRRMLRLSKRRMGESTQDGHDQHGEERARAVHDDDLSQIWHCVFITHSGTSYRAIS